MMIDWLSATIKATGVLSVGYDSGRNFKVIDGLIADESPLPRDVVDDDDPSSSRHFRVFTPNERTLYLSGNPVKLLQGHNLFGSDDLNGLYLEAGLFIREKAALFPSPSTFESCIFSKPTYSRIDLTRSYRFDSQNEVQEYVRHVVGSARSRHGAATLTKDGTAYFGKHSRRWTFKVYDKHSEFLKNSPGVALLKGRFTKGILRHIDPQTSDLLDWSRGIARFELCLRGMELKGVNYQLTRKNIVPNWLDVWTDYFNRIQFNENKVMVMNKSFLEATLKPSQKAVINQWRSGIDLRTVYPKNTFYRHRRAILGVLGVDIASPPDSSQQSEVKTVLEPSRWDPEPIESKLVQPRQEIKEAYKLI